MQRNPVNLSDREYDVLVIGAGAFGAAAARDSALRGLRTALIERADFGGATSAECFKMVHGGIRYLQHADVGLLLLKQIPANAGRSPMKIYEYLAASLPVVSLETDELARRNTPRVFRYRDIDDLNVAFASALSSAKEVYVDETVSWKSITDRVLQFAAQ